MSAIFAANEYDVVAIKPLAGNRAAIGATLCMNPSFDRSFTVIPTAVGLHGRCRATMNNNNRGNGRLFCAERRHASVSIAQ